MSPTCQEGIKYRRIVVTSGINELVLACSYCRVVLDTFNYLEYFAELLYDEA